MKTPHVAILLPRLALAGAERSMLLLGQGLAELGCRVDLLLGNDSPAELPIPGNLRVRCLGRRGMVTCLPALVGYLREERPAALLSGIDHANVLSILATRWAGGSTRLVVSQRSTLSRIFRGRPWWTVARWLPWMARLSYPWADAIVAVSASVARDLHQHLGVAGKPIHVIANPVPQHHIRLQAAEPVEHPWYQDEALKVIITLARLSTEKDLPTLLKAFARLGPETRLLILGEGPERGRLQSLARRLGIDGRVQLAGARPNPFAYLARSHVFALSSTSEGLPRALLEALTLRVPTVATDCPGGCSEILEGGRYGRLVPVGDVEAMAVALQEALQGKTYPAPDLSRYQPETVARHYYEVLLG